MCFSPSFPSLPLFAGYINAHRLYFMPHDSHICTLTAVWRSSNVSQKAMKCTTMTDSKFHTSGLYLCAMIHTVADYFLEMFCLFPKRPWEAFFFPSEIAPRKFFLLQAALCNEQIFFCCYFVEVIEKNGKRSATLRKINVFFFPH